jgi:hypothetical protein
LRSGAGPGIAEPLTLERGTAMDDEGSRRLATLQTEHRDLDSAIHALASMGQPDQIQIARLKKRKLRLKDEIAMLQDMLLPDIIA